MTLEDFLDKWEGSKELANWKRVVSTIKGIDLSGVTILTGDNGSGKSLLRNQLNFRVKKELGVNSQHVSMELRTMNDPTRGAFSSAMSDTSWVATSQSTLRLLDGLFKNLEDLEEGEKRYICIDEFEIGCGEETQRALVRYINEITRKYKGRVGFLIITHSRLGVRDLECDAFENLQGMTKEQYVEREVVPTSLEELRENRMFYFIQDLEKLPSVEDRQKVVED